LLILSIDSSQPVGSVTLARTEGDNVAVIETVQAHGGKFSAQLIPTVKRLLEAHNIEKSHIDVFAAASGPGTFTGLRVGLAAVKALAEILEKPIVTVSVLEALASADTAHERVAVTEAGKGFWYAGIYGDGAPSERHCTGEQLRTLLEKHSQATIVATQMLPNDLAEHGARIVEAPISELVARVAGGKASRREFTEIDALDANYVRSDEALYKTS
jgi:tRNA threonylcarbamoyladenosine biosynthesis protein TsaB